MDEYYLASLRNSGWFSRSSQFTTDLKDAKRFSHADAIKMARSYKAASHILVPVRVVDMELVG